MWTRLCYVALATCISRTRATTTSLMTSCSNKGTQDWKSDAVASSLRSWLQSGVTVQSQGEVESWVYQENQFEKHFYQEYGEEEDAGAVTIGRFKNGVPRGLVWQLRTGRFIDGFLYGEVEENSGKMTGDKIIFIYPDFETGLRGRFKDGELVEGVEIKIVAERCNHGIKELMVKEVANRNNVIWRREETNETFIGSYPKTVDPHEKKSVYVGLSIQKGAQEGLFARRRFEPGQLISYFSGIKITWQKINWLNLTKEEDEIASAYYYMWGELSDDYHNDLVIDIPEHYRDIVNYRTTLAHKTNHAFDEEANAEWENVEHPIFGDIVCMVASEVIEKGEEIFVDYYYDGKDAPDWYMEQYWNKFNLPGSYKGFQLASQFSYMT